MFQASERRPHVLIVEDRPSVLKVFQTVLQREYETTAAPSGEVALSYLETQRFDVVLTDVRMPGASGFDVLGAVRDHVPSTSVVMITAYANVADAVAAIKGGAYDYVAKPLDVDEILLVVARAVEHAQAGAVTETASAETNESVGFQRAVQEARDRASRQYLTRLMSRFRGNVTQAAVHARMTRESLHRVLRKYSVKIERVRLD